MSTANERVETTVADTFGNFMYGITPSNIVEDFANNIDIPDIDDVFQHNMDPQQFTKVIEKIKDEKLRPPLKTYLKKTDEISQINGAYQIKTERQELDGLFRDMSKDISKIEKYKNLEIDNPDKLNKIKNKFTDRSLQYAEKILKKEDKVQREALKSFEVPVLKRGKNPNGSLVFTYNGDIFEREIDINKRKEYIIYDVVTQWAFFFGNPDMKYFKLDLSKVLKKLNIVNNKVQLEVRTSKQKGIVDLRYEKNGEYAVFSLVKWHEIQRNDSWGNDSIYINQFIRSKNHDYENKSDPNSDLLWQYYIQLSKKEDSWMTPTVKGIFTKYASMSLDTSSKQTIFKNNFSNLPPTSFYLKNYSLSDINYEILWMNLSCCCYKKSTDGEKKGFRQTCWNTTTVCDNSDSIWLKSIIESDNSLQAKGVGAEGIRCGSLVGRDTKKSCVGEMNYDSTNKLLKLQTPKFDPFFEVHSGPFTTFSAVPYMLVLRWDEFFGE